MEKARCVRQRTIIPQPRQTLFSHRPKFCKQRFQECDLRVEDFADHLRLTAHFQLVTTIRNPGFNSVDNVSYIHGSLQVEVSVALSGAPFHSRFQMGDTISVACTTGNSTPGWQMRSVPSVNATRQRWPNPELARTTFSPLLVMTDMPLVKSLACMVSSLRVARFFVGSGRHDRHGCDRGRRTWEIPSRWWFSPRTVAEQLASPKFGAVSAKRMERRGYIRYALR